MSNVTSNSVIEEKKGLILFAHGARDERWAAPFNRLKEMTQIRIPNVKVGLAFLDFMSPNLQEIVSDFIVGDIKHITVTPIFLGQGGHVLRDLPLLISNLEKQFPDVVLNLVEAVGEDEQVLLSISQYCVNKVK